MRNKTTKNFIGLSLLLCTAGLTTPFLAQGKTVDLLTVYIEMGKKVDPAVVNIATTQLIHGGGRGGGFGYPGMPMPNDPFRQFFEDFMDPQGMEPPQEEKVQSLGSGFIIDSSGLIVTNNHVIQGANDIQVQLTETSKKTYRAKVIGADKRTDIALIKINAEKPLPFVVLGDSDKVQKGEWVGAFGNPFGYGHTESKGIISSKDRSIELENASYPFLQTDASINPGNSGGPLVNTSDEVIGVNSAIDARAQAIGFAIPINIVKRLLPQLKANGKIVHGFLGVGINTVDDKMVKEFNLKTDHGAIVLSVKPGSPAQKAGIQAYDIITAVNGKDVDSNRDLTNIVAESRVGAVLTLNVIRDGRSIMLKAKIVERPDEISQNNFDEDSGGNQNALRGLAAPHNLGFYISNLTPQIARELELQDVPPKAVVVTGVRPGSLANQAGIQVGDVILDVNRRAVKTARETVKALKKGSNSLLILRGNATLIVFMGTK